LKLFLQEKYKESTDLINDLSSQQLNKKNKSRLKKVLDVMLVGELYGLHTLKSILENLQIRSSNLYKIWQEQTYLQIKNMVMRLSASYFTKELRDLVSKSESSWSRSSVTIIVDDSIFKHWLKDGEGEIFYGKYFSGQHHCSVYGFQVQLIGVALGETFYPLFFQLVSKAEKSKKKALSLIKKVHSIFEQVADSQGVVIPNLYLSVDSGFTDEDLIAYCESKSIGFIGVPKKTNIFTIDKERTNLKTVIEQRYLEEEKVFKNKKPNEAFLIRQKAYFHAEDREVILLFFRLNGSKKVSVLFCSDLSIKSKTLRRRFFQRTKIELFFRLLKDTLKIQKSTSVDTKSFLKKLSLFIFKAIICLQFEKFCRKKFRRFKGWSFAKLRHHIIYQDIDKIVLENIINDRPFAT